MDNGFGKATQFAVGLAALTHSYFDGDFTGQVPIEDQGNNWISYQQEEIARQRAEEAQRLSYRPTPYSLQVDSEG